MRYCYKYLIVIDRKEYGFTVDYNDGFNRFSVCDVFGYPIQATTKAEAVSLARLAIDNLNGKRG